MLFRSSSLNAVLAGVKDLRSAVDAARERLERHGLRTTLFIDEVHRFNSAQQDALLPWVENGTVTLIGATTENPFFEVNKALVSRSRLFRLQPLERSHLQRLLERALRDPLVGYGDRSVVISDAAADHLLDVAGGDARSLLNALELAVETTPPDAKGQIAIDLAIAEESIQQRAVLYDKQGDAHFDTISAFIKSLRGSDADAALFWLARMVEAGENPRFIFRRMLISAGEDIGLADPQAIVVVEACAAAFERVGLPEGLYPLAQAALYLASADKSNSTLGMFDALKSVRQAHSPQVPSHLRDAHRDGAAFGVRVEEALDRVDQRRGHVLVGNALALQHGDAVAWPEPGAVGPAAEAGQVGGDGRHAHRERLLRRVAPRLVVARVDAEVHRRQHGFVLALEQRFVGAQVDRDLHHLHAAAEPVVDAEPLAVRVNRILLLVEQVVRAQPDRAVGRPTGETLEQFAAHAAVAGRHQQERDHAAALGALHRRQRVEQQFDALVVELVAARERQERRVADVLAELAQVRPAAARATRRPGMHDALARQVLRQQIGRAHV